MILCCRPAIVTGTAPMIAKGLLEARGLYQRALEMDPAYAAARAGLALTYIAEVAQRPERSGHRA